VRAGCGATLEKTLERAKPYARIYVDPGWSLPSPQCPKLTGEPVTNQFEFDGLQLAVVGSILIVPGREHDLDR
jgi:hypothetical protein